MSTHVVRPPAGVGGMEMFVEYVAVMGDYWLGFTAGAADANVVAQPTNTNGHTHEAYLEIAARFCDYYGRALVDGKPYIDGYCDGADAVALCRQGDAGCTALAKYDPCPLCSRPLNGEQDFHLDCARRENARDAFDPGTDDADDWAIADRMRFD